MKRILLQWRAALAVAACVCVVASCKQPEGKMPTPTGDQPNRIVDVSHDLRNVARKDSSAPSELLDDLTTLNGAPRSPARLKALGDALVSALGGKNLPDETAKKIADFLFVLISAGDLSRSQIQDVGAQLRETLISVQVTPDQADLASGAAIALANEVTTNHRRWYQR